MMIYHVVQYLLHSTVILSYDDVFICITFVMYHNEDVSANYMYLEVVITLIFFQYSLLQ